MNYKLCEIDKEKIKELYIDGESILNICIYFNIVKSTIYKIVKAANIKHLRTKRTLEGKTFSELYVEKLISSGIYPNGKRYDVYQCKCSCGNIIEKRCHGLKTGISVCCQKCSNNKMGTKGPRLGKIPSIIKLGIKNGAKSRDIYYDDRIDDDFLWNLFLDQDGKCAITGVKLSFGEHSKDTNGRTASLDRIDSSKGYIEGNIQWVHKIINEMKWDNKQDEFIKWCKLVADNN